MGHLSAKVRLLSGSCASRSKVPATLSSHPALTTYEIYKNRITAIDPDYFGATPNLQRLSIQGNGLEGQML